MDENGEDNRLIRKIKENPAVPIGLLALSGIVGYRLFNIKNRTKKLSLYLIELRVVAQGTLLACVVLGAGFKIYQDAIKPKDEVKKH